MSDALTRAREWFENQDGVVLFGGVEMVESVHASLAALLTETTAKALEEALACVEKQAVADGSCADALHKAHDYTGERYYRVAHSTCGMIAKAIRAKAEGGEI